MKKKKKSVPHNSIECATGGVYHAFKVGTFAHKVRFVYSFIKPYFPVVFYCRFCVGEFICYLIFFFFLFSFAFGVCMYVYWNRSAYDLCESPLIYKIILSHSTVHGLPVSICIYILIYAYALSLFCSLLLMVVFISVSVDFCIYLFFWDFLCCFVLCLVLFRISIEI